MKIVTMSATLARKNFFDLINAAHYNGQVTVITKNGEEVARIAPQEQKKFDWKAHKAKLQQMTPFLTDDDVAEYKLIREELNKPRFPEW